MHKLEAVKFRSGQSSLTARVNKRLLEKYNWFRSTKIEEKETKENQSAGDQIVRKWHHYNKRKETTKLLEKEEKGKRENPQKVVNLIKRAVLIPNFTKR